MFKRGEKVVYPRHGAGKIATKPKIKINGKEQQYYKITFFNSPVDVSIPVDQAEDLGLRSPNSKVGLKRSLNKLNKRVRITNSTLKNLDEMSREMIQSGSVDDAINLVNVLRSLAKHKEQESKNFSYSHSQRLEIALDFITSEVEMVLGKNAVKKYDLEIKRRPV